MASDDTPTFIARRAIGEYDAELTRKYADFQQAIAEGDTLSATQYSKEMAGIRKERAAYVEMYNEHVNAQRPPPPPPELTPEEKFAKPWDRMDWQDGLDLARTSKYGKDIDASDPNVQAGFREVYARRQRGE